VENQKSGIMTNPKKSTSVETVEKRSSTKPKDSLDAEAKKLLESTRIEPVIPKKKETRGRPKKKKLPVWNKKTYSNHPLAQSLNGMVTAIINKTALKNAEKLKPEEIEIGEAIAYTVEYYGMDWIDHPLAIMVFAGLGLGYAVYVKSTKKTKLTESVDKKKLEMTQGLA